MISKTDRGIQTKTTLLVIALVVVILGLLSAILLYYQNFASLILFCKNPVERDNDVAVWFDNEQAFEEMQNIVGSRYQGDNYEIMFHYSFPFLSYHQGHWMIRFRYSRKVFSNDTMINAADEIPVSLQITGFPLSDWRVVSVHQGI